MVTFSSSARSITRSLECVLNKCWLDGKLDLTQIVTASPPPTPEFSLTTSAQCPPHSTPVPGLSAHSSLAASALSYKCFCHHFDAFPQIPTQFTTTNEPRLILRLKIGEVLKHPGCLHVFPFLTLSPHPLVRFCHECPFLIALHFHSLRQRNTFIAM